MTTQALRPNDLHMFTGTENWFKHPFNAKMIYTDGARHFAQNAGVGAYWFLDIAATEIYELHKMKDEYFLCIKMHVKGSSAEIIVTNGNEDEIFTKEIPFTDCPEGNWEFFQIHDGDMSTLLVTSEY